MSQNDIANILWFVGEGNKERRIHNARKALHRRADRRDKGKDKAS